MKLFYRDSGGTGRAVLILHGLFGSWTNWQSISKALETEYRVITPDLRNHGRSPHAPEADYRSMTADVAELVDDLSLDSVVMTGHSMGGKIAMLYALEHPERTERLAVFDMAPKSYPPHHAQILAALEELERDHVSSRAEADLKLARRIPDPETRTFLLTNLVRKGDALKLRINLSALSKDYGDIAGWPYRGGGRFDKPVLFIRGGDSDYVLGSDMPDIRKLFPFAELETIPGASHWLHAEKPEAFLSLFTEFLHRAGS